MLIRSGFAFSANLPAMGLMAMVSLVSMPANAQDGAQWWSGDWYLTLGATTFRAPEFNGDDNYMFKVAPLISAGRAGSSVRFSSRNDNPSFAFVDNGAVRAGAAGKLIFKRDEDDSPDLKGLDEVRFGGELGGFAEIYPTDWLRARAEVRKGIRSHHGVVADVAVDAFVDVTDNVRVSGGPRVSFATADYFDAYYGVNAKESAASRLAQYTPSGGMKSAGVGTAITWKPTEKIETTAFAEYERLTGPAADSSLVQQRGSRNQFIFGLSASYRFDFTLN